MLLVITNLLLFVHVIDQYIPGYIRRVVGVAEVVLGIDVFLVCSCSGREPCLIFRPCRKNIEHRGSKV
jgi:hypothetical protein